MFILFRNKSFPINYEFISISPTESMLTIDCHYFKGFFPFTLSKATSGIHSFFLSFFFIRIHFIRISTLKQMFIVFRNKSFLINYEFIIISISPTESMLTIDCHYFKGFFPFTLSKATSGIHSFFLFLFLF